MDAIDRRTLDALLIGESPVFLELKARLPTIAKLQRTTLITGPTGTGKDMIARSLHRQSPRAREPFVPVHCAALPDHLIEAELFGHCRGAFTGAVESRTGLIRSAAKGTVFLDEIDSLSLRAQAKVLRFLENGEFRAVGADAIERSSSWIIAATNQNLRSRVAKGLFRADLLYRLEVLKLEVPPLRRRGEDILVLARHFLHACQSSKRLADACLRALMCHSWPGNVRELKHRIESAALLSEGELLDAAALGFGHPEPAPEPERESRAQAWSSDAPPDARPDARPDDRLQEELWRLIEDEGMSLAEATAQCEQRMIRAALAAEDGNRTRAAMRLGIHVRTIYKKMPALGTQRAEADVFVRAG